MNSLTKNNHKRILAKLALQAVETDIVEISKRVNELAGIKVLIHTIIPTPNIKRENYRVAV